MVAWYSFLRHNVDFKFGTQVYGDKCQPVDDKPFLKVEWLRHVTQFKFLGPQSYITNC